LLGTCAHASEIRKLDETRLDHYYGAKTKGGLYHRTGPTSDSD